MADKEYYYGVDLFKFIGAILVIMLHANPVGEATTVGIIIRQIITPIAVPFFFAASGFLSFFTPPEFRATKVIRILKKYLIWSIIYLPFVVIAWLMDGGINVKNIVTYLKNFVFEGSYQTIWFLNALWVAIAVVFVLLKHIEPKYIFFLSLPFYTISCLLSSWHGAFIKLPFGQVISDLYYSVFETTKNGILFGFTYVSLGVWIAQFAKGKENEKAFSKKRIIGLVLCIVFVIVEFLIRNTFVLNAKGCDITFSLIPITALLLKIAVGIKLPRKPIWSVLRKYSTLLFLTQRVPLTIFRWVDAFTGKYFGFAILTTVPFVYFILVLSSSFFISFCIIRLSKHKKWIARIY